MPLVLANSVGFVVTPSRMPHRATVRISSMSAVSRKIFMAAGSDQAGSVGTDSTPVRARAFAARVVRDATGAYRTVEPSGRGRGLGLGRLGRVVGLGSRRSGYGRLRAHPELRLPAGGDRDGRRDES